MRKTLKSAVVCAFAGLVGLLASALVPAATSTSLANGNVAAKRPAVTQPVMYDPDHHSVIRFRDGELPATKGIRLGRNKSTLIELPRELRDVVVSNPEIMDAIVQRSNRVYLVGKKIGQANAFFFDARGEQVLTLEVSVEHDTAVLDSLYRRLLPGSNIRSEIMNETVILTGSVRTALDATRANDIAQRFIVTPTPEENKRHEFKVINLLNIEGEEQVMLKVTVAEVQRTLLKQLGVNLGAAINSGNFTTRLLTENALPLTAAAGLGTLPVPGLGTTGLSAGDPITCATIGQLCNWNNGPSPGTFGNSGLTNGFAGGNTRVASALRAMERDGLVRTLAEPNLTAVSGESAKFLAGGEYPIPVVDSDGKLSVQYKEFGVSVAFTPIVMSEGRISLKIESEVSELSNSGAVTLSNISIPALKKRQAKSTVELPSGGSLAIAGLISDEVRQNIDGFPGLKDVPILGTLFRSRDFERHETELVIIVTPYVVRPTARQNLARPDDGFAPASDLKANFLGHLNRIYGKGKEPPPGGLKGDYGFIVE